MATLKLRGRSWVLNWSQGARQHRKSLGDIPKQEAKIALHAKELELRTGRRVLPTELVFGVFYREYVDWHAIQFPDSTERIAQIVRQHLDPFFYAFPIDRIGIRDAERYAAQRLSAGVKRATVNKELRTLKAMLNKAIDWEYLRFNPVGRLRQLKETDSKPPRFYSAEEMETIYQWAPYNWHWWRLMANTGMRRAEVLLVQPQRDIGRDEMRIISTEEGRTKSAKWREIPLSENAKMALERFEKGKYLWPRVHARSISRAFENVLRRAPLQGDKGSLHCLRHTFCSHLVMAGQPLRVVQGLAGHANYATTERYAHLAPGFHRDVLGAINL